MVGLKDKVNVKVDVLMRWGWGGDLDLGCE